MSSRPFQNAFFASAYALLASTVVLSGFAYPISALAQSYADHGPGVAVTQASEGSLTTAGGEVILRIASSVVAGRPQFRYLPGSNGETVLTADFEGLSWNAPARVIRLNSPEKGLSNSSFTGIKEIRIAQFQASPSVLRVSFVARDPTVLKKVAIGAAPGLLELSWKAAGSAVASAAADTTTGPISRTAVASALAAGKKNSTAPSKAPSLRLASASQMPPLALTKAEVAAKEVAAKEPVNEPSKEAKGGWFARLRAKTKDYFSTSPEQLAEEESTQSAKPATAQLAKQSGKPQTKHRDEEQSVSAPLAPSIAQTSPAAAKIARMPAMAPTLGTREPITSAFPSIKANPLKESGYRESGYRESGSRESGSRESAYRDSGSRQSGSRDSERSTTNGADAASAVTSSAVTASAATSIGVTGDRATEESAVEKPEVPLGPPPLITLETADPQGSGAKLEIFRVERPDGKQLNFKSFRLHNPERYVVDMPEYRELANSVLPDVSTSPLVSSMRVGLPGESEGAGRLVLQLTDDTVSIDESFNAGSSYMTVTLAKGVTGNAGIARSGNLASPLAATNGPILVPRAPTEKVVVLDAGHGGNDPGAVRGDVQEKEITLQIIAKLKKVLESKGARIVLTRSDDTFVSLEDRVKITNTVSPNLFLSVHINSLESTSNIYGIETYFQTDQSRPLADRVHSSLVSGLGAPDRSVRKARFYVINHTPIPAILAEVGYITNKAERDRLISSDYQQKVASALARGVMLYLQDIKSQNSFANNSSGSVSSSSDCQKPSKLATGSWKPTK
jgi:N-acetylmuramoyl-L-alanine amidase